MEEIMEHRIQIPELTDAEIQEAEQHSPPPPPSPSPSSSLFMSLFSHFYIPRKKRSHRITITSHHNSHFQRRNTASRVSCLYGYKKWAIICYGCFLLFIFFFLLWWFSSSGGLPIKDGRTVHIVSDVKPFSLNNNAVELRHMSFLADAASPNPNNQLLMQ